MSEFFNMGGYAFYVWTSFGISVFGLILMYWLSKRYDQKQHDDVRAWIKRRKQ